MSSYDHYKQLEQGDAERWEREAALMDQAIERFKSGEHPVYINEDDDEGQMPEIVAKVVWYEETVEPEFGGGGVMGFWMLSPDQKGTAIEQLHRDRCGVAALLKKIEWSGTTTIGYGDRDFSLPSCPSCRGIKPDRAMGTKEFSLHVDHRENCELNAYINTLDTTED